MFVTCFYAILNPRNGQLHYANAGHDLPYRWHAGEVTELRATGMPLGLMPGMQYEEKETTLAEGESILLYSDGLVEAHNPERDMFGFPRLIALLGAYQGETSPIDYLRTELTTFTGEGWEQEDDITLVTLRRAVVQSSNETSAGLVKEEGQMLIDKSGAWQVLDTQLIPSKVGNERLAMSYVMEAVKTFNLPERRLEQLKTAVAEATMNAMEHGNHYDPEIPVTLQVLSSESALAVRVSDKGSGNRSIEQEYEVPDIEAKLAELQSPRGWGLFLIQNMVDEMHILSDEQAHTIELILYLEGGSYAQKNA
jgi:anti-sigma regulatory factor (Ser/Thr protein kinase)